MAKQKTRHRRFSRVKHRVSRHKMTIVKGTKLAIALIPPATFTYEAWKSGGPRAAGTNLVKMYSGFDMDTGQFNPADAVKGYAPLGAAWLFGKIASRVLR